ncbi:MAG: DNA polymerase I [Clostridia bacterium]|nr:DNA polymerase I [Clostridia bacterium]
MKKLLIIDGNSILNRAFFGIRALTDKNGRFTNAIFGLVNVLHRELSHLSPDYAAIAFDVHAPTFRKELYDAYKANRHGMPEELHAQLDDAKYCAERMGFCRLELPGYEADDILGTVSAMTESDPDLHVYILSGDRDLLQLISPRVSVLLAGNSETALFDRDAFFAKYGVEPEQFVDVKALMGDSSDNIPGVPGVGEKTAFRLIATHGSLDTVYENLDAPDITKGLRAKLEAGRELAYLSKKLVTILRDAPIDKSLSDLAYHGIDRPALREKFVELEFSGLIRKLELDTPDKAEEQREACPCEKTDYAPADAKTILAMTGEVAVTTDENGWHLSVGGCHVTFTGDARELAPLFDGSRTVITYDAKALYHTLHALGVPLGGIPQDVMLYAYAVDAAGGTPALPALLTAYLSATVSEGEPCAHLLPALRDTLAARVEEGGATTLLQKIELPLAMLLAEMETTGFKIDRTGLEAFREQLEKAMHALTERIYYLAGEEFNINSPKQLGVILFEKLGLPTEKKTKTGYSTDVETLNRLRRIHPIVGEILDYRQIAKLYATYAVGLLHAADEADRIHTDFKQALTATGRLSSAEPNLQNIPIRTELGREMRRFFIPENEEYLLVDADYSQIELRLLAHMAGDERMIEAFRSGEDIHTATAAAVFGVEKDEVTPELRRQAKAVNFGIVYGIGAFSLAGDLGISTAAAKAYIDSYFATYPGIAAYLDAVVEAAYEKGYSTTLYGRRRSIPELRVQNKMTRKFGERVAMNSPIQGTAADIMKIAMLRVDRRLKAEGLDARLVMQVHDELIVEAHKSVAERVALILSEEMGAAADLSVPLTVDVAVTKTWLE